MSKHSIRRGSAGSASTALQRLERVVLRDVACVEARLVGERRVAVGQIDQPALLAALRHERCGRAGRPAPTATLSSTSRSSGSTGTWISGGAPRSS